MSLQFSEQFMQHYLSALSPLAWKLYLHLLFICTKRNNFQLKADEIELDPINQFVNKKQYATELQAACNELKQQNLLKSDFSKQCLWLISPEIQSELWTIERIWQQELASMSQEQKEHLTLSNFVLAQIDACSANNQKLLDYLLTDIQKELDNPNTLAEEFNETKATISLPDDGKETTEYNELVQAINQRFLLGFSSYSWINLIDKLHHEYKFENTLIYALFATLQSDGHLYKDQLQHLADELHKAEVTTAEEYEKWLSAKDLADKRRPFVQANLQRRNLTNADLQIVNKWFDEYGYGEEVISYLFSKSVESTNPTLTWFDAIISRWHQAGYKSLAEIQAAEQAFKANKPKKQAFVRSGLASYQPRSQMDIYTERNYDNAFYTKLAKGNKHKYNYD